MYASSILSDNTLFLIHFRLQYLYSCTHHQETKTNLTNYLKLILLIDFLDFVQFSCLEAQLNDSNIQSDFTIQKHLILTIPLLE